jgi:hypothetical protein
MRVRQYLGGTEALSQAVVQLPRDAAAFFVLCLQELNTKPAGFLLLDGAFAELLREPPIMFPNQKHSEKKRRRKYDHREAKKSFSQCPALIEENLFGVIDLIGNCGSSSGRIDDI